MSFCYILLSIPGFIIIYIWLKQPDGNISAVQYLKFKNIFLNFPIYTSYIAFYLLPILFMSLKYIKKEIIIKYLKIFFIISAFLFNSNLFWKIRIFK